MYANKTKKELLMIINWQRGDLTRKDDEIQLLRDLVCLLHGDYMTLRREYAALKDGGLPAGQSSEVKGLDDEIPF